MTIEPHDVHKIVCYMTDPARRHRCPDCERIFECHVCEIGNTHPLHLEQSDCPFLCLECAEVQEILEVAIYDPHLHEVKFYDYKTGRLVDRTPFLHGWITSGQVKGIWRWCEELLSKAKRKRNVA